MGHRLVLVEKDGIYFEKGNNNDILNYYNDEGKADLIVDEDKLETMPSVDVVTLFF